MSDDAVVQSVPIDESDRCYDLVLAIVSYCRTNVGFTHSHVYGDTNLLCPTGCVEGVVGTNIEGGTTHDILWCTTRLGENIWYVNYIYNIYTIWACFGIYQIDRY